MMEVASSSSQENENYVSNPKDKKDVLLDHMEIAITESEKREAGALNYRDFYIVYLIETKLTDGSWSGAISRISTIWRRYSEFEALRNYFVETFPYLIIPPLPEKMFDVTDKCSDKRRGGLETFLLRCASHPSFTNDKIFMGFLQQEDGWKQSLKVAGYLELAEGRLKTLSTRARQPDKVFEAYRNYASELQHNVGGLLRVRSRLAERSHNVHKLHATYGRVLSEWSSCEQQMGDTLQKAGHHLDSLAANIDVTLEQEELAADQLREYLLYAGSLTTVCDAHTQHLAALERAQGQVEAFRTQRDNVFKGQTSLVSRLFGSVDTDEVRELKCQALDSKIEDANAAVTAAQVKLEEFSERAKADHERFQTQKVSDLHETLASYVKLQAKLCRKDLQTWKHIRDCFEGIP